MNDCCNKKMLDAGLRETETRRILLAILHDSVGPLAPPEIVARCHKAGRKVNKTTVYRDLATMEKAGIIHRVIVSDRTQYFELTERGHHHHFVCTKCEVIRDVVLEEASILSMARNTGKKIGFSISTHAFEFYGRCRTCQ